MNGFFFLLCCIEILGTVCRAQTTPEMMKSSVQDYPDTALTVLSTDLTNTTSGSSSPPEAISLKTTQSIKSVAQSSKSPSTSPSHAPQPVTPNSIFYSKDCRPVLLVTGGLMIGCTILLLSTLLLSWKACQLSRRITALSSNAELISDSEYWVGSAKKNKSKAEAEPKETTVLMSNVSQTQEEVGNGTTKEEGGKVNEDGQMGEEQKKEEEGDDAKSEEASATPVTVAESSSASKPQEEATESQPTKDVAASTSESTEEPKDVV